MINLKSIPLVGCGEPCPATPKFLEIFQKMSLDHIRVGNEMKNSLENESFIYFIHKIQTVITKMVFTNQFVLFFNT